MNKIKLRKAGRIAILAAGAAAIVLVFVLLVRLVVVSHGSKDENRAENYNRYTFTAKTLSGMKDFMFFYGDVDVFTDSGTGLKGLIRCDGTVLQEAQYSNFYVCSDSWHSFRYVAEKEEGSPFPMIIDTETGTVTSKQYQGLTAPTRELKWDSAEAAASWFSGEGEEELKDGEVYLDRGLYAIETTEGKWSFVNENLVLAFPITFDYAADFTGEYAPVMTGEKWGWINRAGTQVLECVYDDVSSLCAGCELTFPVRNGFVPVKKDGKMGIVNVDGQTVVPFVFDSILPGEQGRYIACKKGRWGTLVLEDADSLLPDETTAPPADTSNAGQYKVSTSGDPLNMRANPSSTAAVIMKLANGTKLTVSEFLDGWAHADFKGKDGWVSAEYITRIEDETTTDNAVG